MPLPAVFLHVIRFILSKTAVKSNAVTAALWMGFLRKKAAVKRTSPENAAAGEAAAGKRQQGNGSRETAAGKRQRGNGGREAAAGKQRQGNGGRETAAGKMSCGESCCRTVCG